MAADAAAASADDPQLSKQAPGTLGSAGTADSVPIIPTYKVTEAGVENITPGRGGSNQGSKGFAHDDSYYGDTRDARGSKQSTGSRTGMRASDVADGMFPNDTRERYHAMHGNKENSPMQWDERSFGGHQAYQPDAQGKTALRNGGYSYFDDGTAKNPFVLERSEEFVKRARRLQPQGAKSYPHLKNYNQILNESWREGTRSPSRKRLHQSYEERLGQMVNDNCLDPGGFAPAPLVAGSLVGAAGGRFKPGDWWMMVSQKVLAALEKLEKHITRPRGIAEMRSIINVMPESSLPKFISLVFNPRKPMNCPKAQREVFFFLPALAAKYPTLEKMHRPIQYCLSFLKDEKHHAGVSRCMYDLYLALGSIPDNFPLISSLIFERCKLKAGHSLNERRGCIHVLQHLVQEICEKGGSDAIGIDFKHFTRYIVELCKTSHDLHDALFVLVSQLAALNTQVMSGKHRKNEFRVFENKKDLEYLCACMHKHLSAPSEKPNIIDQKSHAYTAYNNGANWDRCNSPRSRQMVQFYQPDEFMLNKDQAFACCVALGHLAKYYGDFVKEHKMVVLQVLDKENLDLWRLVRCNENLRRSLKYATTQWQKLCNSEEEQARNNLNTSKMMTSMSHSGLMPSQHRMDQMFSKKALVNDIADHLIDESDDDSKTLETEFDEFEGGPDEFASSRGITLDGDGQSQNTQSQFGGSTATFPNAGAPSAAGGSASGANGRRGSAQSGATGSRSAGTGRSKSPRRGSNTSNWSVKHKIDDPIDSPIQMVSASRSGDVDGAAFGSRPGKSASRPGSASRNAKGSAAAKSRKGSASRTGTPPYPVGLGGSSGQPGLETGSFKPSSKTRSPGGKSRSTSPQSASKQLKGSKSAPGFASMGRSGGGDRMDMIMNNVASQNLMSSREKMELSRGLQSGNLRDLSADRGDSQDRGQSGTPNKKSVNIMGEEVMHDRMNGMVGGPQWEGGRRPSTLQEDLADIQENRGPNAEAPPYLDEVLHHLRLGNFGEAFNTVFRLANEKTLMFLLETVLLNSLDTGSNMNAGLINNTPFVKKGNRPLNTRNSMYTEACRGLNREQAGYLCQLLTFLLEKESRRFRDEYPVMTFEQRDECENNIMNALQWLHGLAYLAPPDTSRHLVQSLNFQLIQSLQSTLFELSNMNGEMNKVCGRIYAFLETKGR